MSTPPPWSPPGGVPPFPPSDFGPAMQRGPQPWPVGPMAGPPFGPPAGPPVGPGFPAPYPHGFYPLPAKRPPRKFWYAIGAALLALGLALGLVGGVGGVARIKGKQPQSEATFSSGGSTTVHLDPGTRKVLFVADTATGGHPVQCVAAGGAVGRVSLNRYTGAMTLNRWQAMFTLEATASGDYTVSCRGAPTDTFGVGGYVSPLALILSVVSSVVGLVLALAGAVTIIVTAVLRRRRLQQAGPHY